ncbi:MAG: alpha/beta hydrolase [Lysinibacillus sp.]
MALHPAAKVILEQLEAAGAPPMSTLTPEEARTSMDIGLLAGIPEAVASVEERRIPGPAGDIPVRIYTPEGQGPFPAIIYYHGGGWVIGNLDVVDVPCRLLANRTGCVVISVDYRLAPEHPFPAPAEDAYAAVEWVANHGETIFVDTSKLVVSGDSAGGNLAAVVCLMAKDKGGPEISYQILFYPVTEHSYNTKSYQDNAQGYFLTKDSMEWFWNHYLQEEENGEHPYASPLRAEDVSGLPPALVITAEYDPLRDEGEAYAKKLLDAGVGITLKRYEGMIHGFIWMSGALPQGGEAIELAAEELNGVF